MTFLSLVQLVASVSVVFAPCPDIPRVEGYYSSCYHFPTKTIYLSPDAVEKKETLAHEYGHADDIETRNPAFRVRIKRILGFRVDHPWWGAGMGRDEFSPAEYYAEAFAMCALGREKTIEFSRRQLRLICAMLTPSMYAIFHRRSIGAAYLGG